MLLLVIPHPEKGFQLLQACSMSFLTTDQLVHLVSQAYLCVLTSTFSSKKTLSLSLVEKVQLKM